MVGLAQPRGGDVNRLLPALGRPRANLYTTTNARHLYSAPH